MAFHIVKLNWPDKTLSNQALIQGVLLLIFSAW